MDSRSEMRCFQFGEDTMRLQIIQRVGNYLRLSRDDGNCNAESMSIANQKQLLADYVRERGWDLVEVYIDDGYSGTTFVEVR